MPLESATYISDLNTSNPVGSTDKVQTLDDHVRLIKSTLKTTFPNVNGAMTSSDEELNILDGATLSVAELNLLDGVTASTAELNILDGVTLTAAQINDAARKSVNNDFTGVQTYTTAGDANHLTITAGSCSSFYGSGTGIARLGTSSNHHFDFYTNNTVRLHIESDGSFDFKAGTVTTTNASASEVGFKGTPQNAQNGDYTLVLTDAGKTIYKASGGAGETITIPANGTVAFPVGTVIRIVNNGGGTLTIAITSDTLTLAGAGTTGSRTLADDSVAVIEKVSSTEWFISGVGLS